MKNYRNSEGKLKFHLGYTKDNVECEDTSMDEYTDDYVAFVAEQMRVLNNPCAGIRKIHSVRGGNQHLWLARQAPDHGRRYCFAVRADVAAVSEERKSHLV